MNAKRIGILVAVWLAACGAARAEEWAVVGGAARGRGGTGVALDPSPYWNPAALHAFPEGKDASKISNFLDGFDLASSSASR